MILERNTEELTDLELRFSLPDGWRWRKIIDICQVNPTMSKPEGFLDTTEVSFVPMSAVDEQTGTIVSPEIRPLSDVWKGYKRFQNKDVIFARITPCMENGKAAIADELTNGIGCGSTEFHVLRARPNEAIPAWLYHFVRQESFRDEAAASFAGTAGQLRVPANFLEQKAIPVPSIPEQRRIVAKLESILAQLRTARTALDHIPSLLKTFRQSVLAAAFRGELTERDPGDEPAEILLERIRAERRHRWEESLCARGKDPANYTYEEPVAPDTSNLPELPEGWMWSKIGSFFDVSLGGTPARDKPEYWNGQIPWVSSGEVAFCHIKGTKETISDLGLSHSNAKYNPAGSVLLAMIGEGKTRGQAAILDISATTNQNIAAINCTVTPIKSECLFYWFMHQYEEIRGGGLGGAQPALNAGRIKEIVFPVIPVEEQKRIIAKLVEFFRQIEIVESVIKIVSCHLDEFEQTMLSKAFRGELS
jgi:type I restriction enzyme S subunit